MTPRQPKPAISSLYLLLLGIAAVTCSDPPLPPGPDTTGDSTVTAVPPTRCPAGEQVCVIKHGDVVPDPPWIAGPLASAGQSGSDRILTNGLARYVIRGADKGAAMYGTRGGLLVDVGRLGPDGGKGPAPMDPLRELVLTVDMHLVQPNSISSGTLDDGAVYVRIEGPLVPFPTLDEALSKPLPKVSARHDYILRPDTTALEILTTLTPTEGAKAQVLVADLLFWGGEVAMYLPEYGDQKLPAASLNDTIGFTPRRPGRAITSPPFSCVLSATEKMSTLDAGAIKTIMHGTIKVTSEGTTVRRVLACGGRHGRDLAAAMHEAREAIGFGTSADTAKGVVAPGSGEPAIEVMDEQGRRLTRCDAVQDRQFNCPMPPGAHHLAAGWLGDNGNEMESGGQPATGTSVVLDGVGPYTLSAPPTATLQIKATRDGKPLPVRVTVRPTDADPDKLRRRSFADFQGEATHLMPPGAYDVWLSAGPLSAMHHEKVTLVAGATVQVKATLPQVVSTPGWIAADLHVHAEPSSDSSVPVARRLAGAAVEGLDYLVATDHDVPTDYRQWLVHSSLLGAGEGDCIAVGHTGARVLTAIGEEVSTLKTGHFNVWPILAGPEGAVAWYKLGPEALLQAVGGGEAKRVVQCNHPRFEAFSYFKAIDFDAKTTGKELLACHLMELVNGASHSETPEVIVDWLGLLARGIRITATGVSDCHSMAEVVGSARTWVFMGEQGSKDLCSAGGGAIDKALVAGRAVASGGPFVTVQVQRGSSSAKVGELLAADSGEGTIKVRVAAPEWLPLGTLDVYVGLAKVASEVIGMTQVKDGARVANVSAPLPASATDTSVVVVHIPAPGASGWPGIHRPPWVVTNPVLVDGDGDGTWFGQAIP